MYIQEHLNAMNVHILVQKIDMKAKVIVKKIKRVKLVTHVLKIMLQAAGETKQQIPVQQ